MDDWDDDYPIMGQLGSVSTLSERKPRRVKKQNPIGFIHFPVKEKRKCATSCAFPSKNAARPKGPKARRK